MSLVCWSCICCILVCHWYGNLLLVAWMLLHVAGATCIVRYLSLSHIYINTQKLQWKQYKMPKLLLAFLNLKYLTNKISRQRSCIICKWISLGGLAKKCFFFFNLLRQLWNVSFDDLESNSLELKRLESLSSQQKITLSFCYCSSLDSSGSPSLYCLIVTARQYLYYMDQNV